MLKEIGGGFGIVLPENGVMLLWFLAIENGACCCCWVVQWKRGAGKVGVVFLRRNKHLLFFLLIRSIQHERTQREDGGAINNG